MAKLIKFEAEVIRNEYITPTVFELELKADRDFDFLAGQFVQITLPDPRTPEKKIKRSYSILSAPEEENLRFCIKLVEDGLGSPQLSQLKKGDTLHLTGPFGRFTYKESERIPFFISTGTGLAPFYSMVKSMELRQQNLAKAICLHGVRFKEEVLYDSYFKNCKGLDWIPAVSKPQGEWHGYTGRVTNYILQLNDFNFQNHDYYLCGNGAMIKEVKTLLMENGVDKKQIFQEIYFT